MTLSILTKNMLITKCMLYKNIVIFLCKRTLDVTSAEYLQGTHQES